MAYATGTAANPTALLQALATFLTSNGWTSAAAGVDGSGYRAHLHRSGVYVNLRAAENEAIWTTNNTGTGYGIGVYLGTGYSGAAAWNAQAGGPAPVSENYGAGMILPAGPYVAHHFHQDADGNVVVVVEHTGGIFAHLGFGLELSKETHTESLPYFWGSQGSYYNTSLSGASNINHGTLAISMTEPTAAHQSSSTINATAFVKVPSSIQPAANNWISNGVGAAFTGAMGVRLGVPFHSVLDFNSSGQLLNEHPRYDYLKIVDRRVATAFPRALILPPILFAPDPITSRWRYLGAIPNAFGCGAVGNGWAAGDTLTIGGLDYRVYPNIAARYIP